MGCLAVDVGCTGIPIASPPFIGQQLGADRVPEESTAMLGSNRLLTQCRQDVFGTNVLTNERQIKHYARIMNPPIPQSSAENGNNSKEMTTANRFWHRPGTAASDGCFSHPRFGGQLMN